MIVPGVPTTGSGSSNSIRLALSYDNYDDIDQVTDIGISWRETNGNSMGSVTVDVSKTSYTITGLTASTEYTITLFAIGQCGNGPENTFPFSTESGIGPMPTPTTLMPMATPNTVPTDNSTEPDSS